MKPRLLAVSVILALVTAGCSGGSDEPEPTPEPSESASSAPTVLDPTPVPEITGEPRNGETLTAHAGTWGPGDVTLAFRWTRDGDNIVGAVEDTYALTNEDVGHELSVRVTGTKSGFDAVEQDSEPVGPIRRATLHSNKPTITGDAVFGQRVRVDDLDWGSEDVRFRYQWLRDGVAIADATDRGYRLGLDDVNRRIAVEVTGRLAGFDPAVVRSAPIGPVRTAALTSAPRPKLNGVPRYFEILSVPDPGWRPRPITLRYQWFQDGTPMPGVTGASYQLRGRDIGHRVKVQVTGTKAGYTTEQQFTPALGPIKEGRLDPTPRPTVTGTVAVDRTLTGAVGTWGPAPVTFGWQWYRGKTPIRGATAPIYQLTVADLGERILVRVLGQAQFFADRSRDSAPTGPVQPGDLSPTPTPLYSGEAQVGETITALPREWGPGKVNLAYQWYRGNNPISGATKVTYVASPADVGKRLRVRVTGSRTGYRSSSQKSGKTAVISEGVLTSGNPTITGLPVATQTLTAHSGDWGPGDVDLKYQWYRDDLQLTRADESTYTLTADDVGHQIYVRVTGSKKGYATEDVTSAPTDPITPRER